MNNCNICIYKDKYNICIMYGHEIFCDNIGCIYYREE